MNNMSALIKNDKIDKTFKVFSSLYKYVTSGKFKNKFVHSVEVKAVNGYINIYTQNYV